MKEQSNDILLALIATGTGIVTTITAWVWGGRQKNKNERTDAITRGTDKIVETSNRMLDRLNEMVIKAQEAAEIEREHRNYCEKELSKIRKEFTRIKSDNQKLIKRIEQLESKSK